MPLFEAHPETASLLAASNKSELFAQVLQNEDCYNIITGLFAQHAAPEDAAALAKALDIHSSLICRLVKRGLIGSQALFIFPRDNPGAQEYDRWLSEVLDNALAQSDDKLSSLINLLFEQGTNIRAKMIDDDHFRYTFRNNLWAKFIRVTQKTQYPFELYLSDPHLWEFLALSQGEQLLEQWHWFLSIEQINNLTPAAVLFGKDAYPAPLHTFIIDAILENDTNTLVSLLYFGRAPLFVKLMQRDLSDDIIQQAFNILSAQGANYPVTLANWDKASDADLQYELVKGDSSTIHTFKKVVQGRDISGAETFWAIVDIADIAFNAATLGTGAIVTSSVKFGVKKAVKSAAKSALKQVSKEVAKNASEKLLVSFAKKEIFSKMLRKEGEKLLTFDLTSTLKFLVEKQNVNQATFKRINNEWDAHLLLDPNARILVQVNHKKLTASVRLFYKVMTAMGIESEVVKDLKEDIKEMG